LTESHEAELEKLINDLWEAIDDTHGDFASTGDFKHAEDCKTKLKDFISSKIQEARGHYGESK
jgi:hypothetical protein